MIVPSFSHISFSLPIIPHSCLFSGTLLTNMKWKSIISLIISFIISNQKKTTFLRCTYSAMIKYEEEQCQCVFIRTNSNHKTVDLHKTLPPGCRYDTVDNCKLKQTMLLLVTFLMLYEPTKNSMKQIKSNQITANITFGRSFQHIQPLFLPWLKKLQEVDLWPLDRKGRCFPDFCLFMPAQLTKCAHVQQCTCPLGKSVGILLASCITSLMPVLLPLFLQKEGETKQNLKSNRH